MLQKFESGLGLDSQLLGLQATVKQSVVVSNGRTGQTNSSDKNINGINGKSQANGLSQEEKLLQSVISGKWANALESNSSELQKFVEDNKTQIEAARHVLRNEWVHKAAQFTHASISWNKALNISKFEPSKTLAEFIAHQSDSSKVAVIEFLITLLTVFKGHFLPTSYHHMLTLIGFIVDRTSLENADERSRSVFESCIQTVSELLAETQLLTSIQSSIEMIQKSQASNRKVLRYEPIEF
jgi:hypothetical protein